MNFPWYRRLAGLLCACGLVLIVPYGSPAQEVAASIHVPPAEAYVLGDDIPLIWRFTNRSSDPLAMLWEGCCRLNGKLAITANNRAIEVLPPGASSFHTYSKAETLPPGTPMDFSSRLADWVRLPSGGEFEIGGRYTGVLTNQKPQVPSGLALWTGTATAAPAGVKVLGVREYLDQRDRRSRERRLEIGLTGPDRLPALAPVALTATLRNLGDEPQAVDWPGSFQLWLVDERGWRLEKGIRHLQASGEHLVIPPHGELKREFMLSAADLNGESFGRLLVFLDLGGDGTKVKRVPSSPLNVDWSLGPAETVELLNRAASGPATGMRNPALKLLRQYVVALQPALIAAKDHELSTERARVLRDELVLAGCVLPLAPKPGSMYLPLQPASGGVGWSIALPGGDCPPIDRLGISAQVGRIADVRRHLGWDITVEAMPAAGTSMRELSALAEALASQREHLAAPLTWRLPQSDGTGTNHLQFPTSFPAVDVVIRVRSHSGQLLLEAARKPPQRNRPAWANLLSTAEARTLPGTELADSKALREWLGDSPGALQPLIVIDDDVTCGELRVLLQPLIDVSLRCSIVSDGMLR